jgi:hypothetical protein
MAKNLKRRKTRRASKEIRQESRNLTKGHVFSEPETITEHAVPMEIELPENSDDVILGKGKEEEGGEGEKVTSYLNNFTLETQEFLEENGFLEILGEGDINKVLANIVYAKYLLLRGMIVGGLVPENVFDDPACPIGVITLVLQERLEKDGFKFSGYDITEKPHEPIAA